jgi:hypothetical protein
MPIPGERPPQRASTFKVMTVTLSLCKSLVPYLGGKYHLVPQLLPLLA